MGVITESKNRLIVFTSQNVFVYRDILDKQFNLNQTIIVISNSFRDVSKNGNYFVMDNEAEIIMYYLCHNDINSFED